MTPKKERRRNIIGGSECDSGKFLWVFCVDRLSQRCRGDAGVKAFTIEDLLLLAIGEACLTEIRSSVVRSCSGIRLGLMLRADNLVSSM